MTSNFLSGSEEVANPFPSTGIVKPVLGLPRGLIKSGLI